MPPDAARYGADSAGPEHLRASQIAAMKSLGRAAVPESNTRAIPGVGGTRSECEVAAARTVAQLTLPGLGVAPGDRHAYRDERTEGVHEAAARGDVRAHPTLLLRRRSVMRPWQRRPGLRRPEGSHAKTGSRKRSDRLPREVRAGR